jgi:hypothetical protein
MIDKKYRRYVQSFLLVLPMTGLVCAINTLVARGLPAVFTMGTLERWGISLAVAYPAVLLVQPLAVKLTDQLVKND